jgi:hypothetical protein
MADKPVQFAGPLREVSIIHLYCLHFLIV